MEIIKKGWRGEYKPLDLIFALIFFSIVFVIIIFVILKTTNSLSSATLLLAPLYVLSYVVSIWFSVALWRGSEQSVLWWKFIVRGLVIYAWISTLLKWLS